MSSVIVAAPPFTGELQPLLQVASHLVGRGHDVTVLTGSRFGDQVAATGASFAARTGPLDLDDRRLAETFPHMADLQPGPDQMNFVLGLIADAIPDEHDQLQQLLAADPGAALVTNSVFLGPWAVALGAPGRRPRRWLAVGCNPLALSSSDTSALGPVPAGPDGDSGAANRAANAALAASLAPTRRRIETAVRSRGAHAPVPEVFDGLVTVPDLFASLTVPGLEFTRSDAPDSLHLVGVLPAPDPEGWTPPPWWPALESARADGKPVVVVTQGTFANHDLGQLVAPTLAALAGDDVLVVAALGRERDALAGPVPANAHVEEFIPFGQLLPRADVLVTNGGFGATQQALAAGVRVVVAGATEDKALVSARVAARRVGRDLGTSTPTPAAVRDAVLGVLADPGLPERLRALAADYARHDALSTIETLALPEAGG